MKKLLSVLICVCLLLQLTAVTGFASTPEENAVITLGDPVTLSFAAVGDVHELTWHPAEAGEYTFTLAGDAGVSVALLMVEGADNIYIGGGNATFTESVGAYESVTVRVECVGAPGATKTLTVTAAGEPVPDPEPGPDPEPVDPTLALDTPKVLTFTEVGNSYRLILAAPTAGNYTFAIAGDCQVFVSLFVAAENDNVCVGSDDQTFTQTLEDGYEELEVCVECVGNPGTCTITVTKEELDLPPTLASIEVSTLPTKVEYLEGKDALDLTGAKLKLIYSDESHEEIDLTPDMVTGFNNAEVGEQTLTVTYEGLTAEFKVAVVAKSVVSIAVTTKPTKLTYVEGDALDTTGMVVTATYDNDDTAEVTEWDVAADMDVAGTVTVTVIYDGKSTTFEVTVNHDYAPADCDTPATCKICKATTGKALGHKYGPATCTEPATCSVCKATTGKALGHKYSPATCTKPATCSVCKATTGKAKGHTYVTTTTKATLKKNGSIVKKCACGEVESKTTIRYAKTVKLSTTSYTYNGKAKKPSVIVKDSAGKTISSKYYSVSYPSGRKNVGSYKVKVTFKTRYSGTKYLTFKINPPKTTVKSLTAGKKSLKVSITKKSSQVTGYQVQYSTSKKFTKATTKTVKSYKTTSYTIKSLSAKKTYYVRVRTFKTVKGVKYYSGWSTAKYKKTK